MGKKLVGESFIVDRRCRICTHVNRAEIEQALLVGERYTNIAKQYDISISSIHRHFSNHMAELILDQKKLQDVYEKHREKQFNLQEELFKMVDQLKELLRKLEIIDEKFSEGEIHASTYVQSINARRYVLNDIKKILVLIDELQTDLKTEKDISELLEKLRLSTTR